MTVNGAEMLRHGHLCFSLPVFEINAIFAVKIGRNCRHYDSKD